MLSLSAEGTLRCHRVPLASAERTAFGLPALSATLSGDAGLAVLRNQRVPTELQVIDRRTERVLLERSPAGYDSLLSPNGTRLFIMDATEIRCVDLETREDRWAAPIEANATWGTSAVYAFLGQQLVEVAPSGPVRAFDPETGERKELIQLDPAPKGQLDGATFARDGALLVVLAVDETVCYDVRTGKKLWAAGVGRWFADPSHGTLDAAEELCLVVDSSAQPRVVRLATGERFGPAAEGPAAAQGAVAIRSVIAVDGGKAAIVALATGELRRVELADGATSARSGNAIGWVTELDPRTRGAHVLAMNHGAKARLIDAESLEAVAGATLEESVRWETFSADGRFGVASQPNPKRMRLVRLTEDLSGEVVFDQARHAAAAAFSLSGDVLALVIDGRLELRDGRTGEARADFDLSSDVQFNEAAFHRENELVLGTSGVDYGPYGAEVIDTNSGKVLAKVHFDDPFGGGTVMHIHSSPAEGLVILTASACGTVEAFDDSTWKSRYAHPTNGGNWGTLVVRHEPGASVAAISGMTAQHARLFEVATGKIVAWGKNVEGLFDLALVDEGRRIIGVRNQRLAVLDAATYETLYTREEAADGNAWLLRDGVRRAAPGSHAIRADPVHIIHDGWSAPIDSFDAWLYDPLARGEPSLVSLPLLPVIQAVRRVPSEADAVLEALEITAHSREPILGAVIGWPDRDETFVAFAAQANLPDAPTPAEAWRLGLLGLPSGWTSIRLVAESGALSRAHRAR